MIQNRKIQNFQISIGSDQVNFLPLPSEALMTKKKMGKNILSSWLPNNTPIKHTECAESKPMNENSRF